MRIDGFQNIPALLQSFKVEENTKSNSGNGSSGPSSSVSLSSFGEVLQSLQRESAQSLKARASHVDQLAQQNQAGNISVDLDNLASRLVDSHVINFQG